MATATRRTRKGVVLEDVPYKAYAKLVKRPSNAHLRMTYHDGTLEIMTIRHYYHEMPSRRLGLLVFALTSELGIPSFGAGSTTFHRGTGPLKGYGKEPDQSFYFGDEARIAGLLGKDRFNLDAGDPPPDLWIEIDNRASSAGKLPLYAALGVPEVWRYRSRKKVLVFLRLAEGGTYGKVDRSIALPMLTPSLVLEGLALGEGLSESAWDRNLRAWVRKKLAPNA